MTIGLLLTALGLGLRHGVDWDHIAAIADMTSSAESRRRGFVLSSVYALGHAAVVFALGIGVIVFGAQIPDSVDAWMGRVVAFTLIFLGVWVAVQLVRTGRDFRLRSRWMLVTRGIFHGIHRVRQLGNGRVITVEHEHEHVHNDSLGSAAEETHRHDHQHAEHPVEDASDGELVAAGRSLPERRGLARLRRAHRHTHRHEARVANNVGDTYETSTAAGIGLLHGVGIESPTQIAVFVAATSAAGTSAGVTLLGAWVVGLLLANAGLAVLAGFGLLHAERSFAIYATLAVLVAVASITLGIIMLSGAEVLPGLLV